jgi:hypothetical protein
MAYSLNEQGLQLLPKWSTLLGECFGQASPLDRSLQAVVKQTRVFADQSKAH